LLQQISEISKPYVRGNNLVGRKISDWFFMSEIGSIKSRDILWLIESLKSINKDLADLVKGISSGRPTISNPNPSPKLSEAQFYALKEVFRGYGLDLNYKRPLNDTSNGFKISML
jgi:hypothetical protein